MIGADGPLPFDQPHPGLPREVRPPPEAHDLANGQRVLPDGVVQEAVLDRLCHIGTPTNGADRRFERQNVVADLALEPPPRIEGRHHRNVAAIPPHPVAVIAEVGAEVGVGTQNGRENSGIAAPARLSRDLRAIPGQGAGVRGVDLDVTVAAVPPQGVGDEALMRVVVGVVVLAEAAAAAAAAVIGESDALPVVVERLCGANGKSVTERVPDEGLLPHPPHTLQNEADRLMVQALKTGHDLDVKEADVKKANELRERELRESIKKMRSSRHGPGNVS
ncbi:hypothetical protein QBC47DRAFT_402464 [Echria macrotheca]|uniref:Uncharacterized protein n=1 Tax=Echria macrotheca TaxID=438768 RepID=A0AAJ0BDK2_9PEZI|nr:hypothetical protein QBC47DRAFT_402464 [Echria macrotheca]